MIYKPQKGQIKDDCMIYENDKFYLFSMYTKENSDVFNNVWLAISEDGVNFEDYGCVVDNFENNIWAMKIYRVKDGFMMNSGSFGPDGRQNILKFWYSKDLINWEYKPELEVISPDIEGKRMRLDCMCALQSNGKYYGYATGQFGFLESDDGLHWSANKSKINYFPFPEYNRALGGFEIADFIHFEDKYYLFCGGFGHLGNNGYGVYIYECDTPDGTFKPHLPNYRINGTSRRWVNMWERFFEKDGDILANNYMYDGYTYEKGNVWLPPIKILKNDKMGLHLEWWDGNDKLIGDLYTVKDTLIADNGESGVFDQSDEPTVISQIVGVQEKSVIEFDLTLEENEFTQYSSGGFYLAEDENSGTAIIFDTYGKCEIYAVKESKKVVLDDTITFGSSAPYYLDSGKTYHIKLLVKENMFEIYVDNRYLQTFNTTHYKDTVGKSVSGFAAISDRMECKLQNIKIYEMKI